MALQASPTVFGQAASEIKDAPLSPLPIAAAANLVHVLDALNAVFRKTNPQVAITVATGASGTLVAQIKNGAPYDVFLSADLDYPNALLATGDAAPNSLVPFARGQLALWTTAPDLNATSIEALLNHDRLRKLAIANPSTAPYGRAAKQVLEHLGLWSQLQSRLVFGENITQTAQFIDTGNADAGFVALSLLLAPSRKPRGHWRIVPASWHTPLTQAAVLTRRGADNPAARNYLKFLRSAEAQQIFAQYGYLGPEESQRPERTQSGNP